MQEKNIFWRFVIPNNMGSLTLNNKSMNKPFFNKIFLTFSSAMLLTSMLSAQTPCANNPSKIICDDFETYNVANLSPQAAHWIPWNLTDNSAAGAEVSTDFASNGTKAMKVKRDGATGGDDQLLKLGNKSTGRYELKWKMYIPAGKAAYINVQTDENNPGASNANFAFQMYFRANGKYDMDIPTPTVSGDYTQGQWISLRFVFDLNNNIGKLFLNNNIARSWAYTQNLGAINFYCDDATYLFYVDEVEYVQLTNAVFNADVCNSAVDLSLLFGQAVDAPQTSALQDNSTATIDVADGQPSCFKDNLTGPAVINNSMWYTFAGDGAPYFIQTVPCAATNYIGGQDSPGDTQLAIYSGSDCANLTEVACNEDLFEDNDPATDFRAGVEFVTQPGTNYYMMVDGWSSTTPAVVAVGQYCVQVTRKPSVTCENASVGTYTLNNQGIVCWNQNLTGILEVDPADYKLPDGATGINGLSWALTAQAVSEGVWPPSLGNAYFGGTQFLQQIFEVSFANTDPQLTQPVQVYVTPVVIGGGALLPGQTEPFMENVDPANACFFVGESKPFLLIPETAEFNASASSTLSNGSNGTITLTVEGGLAGLVGDQTLYSFSWTGPNGFTATTQNLSGLAPGSYTVEISDLLGGCTAPFSLTVSVTSDVNDPAFVRNLSVFPNPTTGRLNLDLNLEQAIELQIEVFNAMGQMVQQINAGNVSTYTKEMDLSGFSNGIYMIRFRMDGETAVRRVTVQK